MEVHMGFRAKALLTTCIIIAALGASASAASASPGVIYWNCTVDPDTWCQLSTQAEFYQTVVVNHASFDVTTGTKFIFPGTENTIAEADGNTCPTCINPDVNLSLFNDFDNKYALVFNADPVNKRTFYMSSAHY